MTNKFSRINATILGCDDELHPLGRLHNIAIELPSGDTVNVPCASPEALLRALPQIVNDQRADWPDI